MQSTTIQSGLRKERRATFYVAVLAFTLLAAIEFPHSMLPGMSISGRILNGIALFLGIAVTIRTPQRISSAVRSPALFRCAAVGVESGAIALVILLLAYLLLPPEIKFDSERCQAVAAMIESGKLPETRPGVVELPSQLASATFDGKVYVASLPAGRLYLFKTMIVPVRTFEFRGYIYSTVQLSKLSTERDSEGYPWIDGNAIDWGSGLADVLPLSMGLSPRLTIGDHWFRVSTCDGDPDR